MIVENGLTAKQRFWLEHIESCASSGVTMRAYSEQHGLDLQHFYSWKKQLKALSVLSENGLKAGRSKRRADRQQTCALHQPPAPFLRAAVVSTDAQSLCESSEREHSCGARIILANGIMIDVPTGIAPDALGALIHTAMQVSAAKGISGS